MIQEVLLDLERHMLGRFFDCATHKMNMNKDECEGVESTALLLYDS